jgi:hypothetical protein
MATVRLESYDGRVLDLPPRCMRCAAPSTTIRSRKFSWHPQWVTVLLFVGLLPYVIVALILTKKARVEVPLCDRHKHHWLWRLLFLAGVPVVLVVGTFLLWLLLSNLGGQIRDSASFVWVICASLFILWLIAAAIMESLSIRPEEITDTTISLSGVAKAFRDAYEDELTASENDLDENVREHWRDRRRRDSRSIRRRPRHDFEEDEERPDTFRERER